MSAEGFFAICVVVALLASGVALLLAFARLVKGPTLADRVVALDLVTMIVVIVLTLVAMHVGEEAYLDAALALALVAFLATVAFARYIDRSPRPAVMHDEAAAERERAAAATGDVS